jgi:hypothetical protein
MRVRASKRPVIDPERTPWDRVAEFLSLLAVAWLVLMPLLGWSAIPEQVPRHFEFTGTTTAWTGRISIIFPVLIGVAMYAGLTLLNRVPHIFNYPWPITEQNARTQYQLARSMLSWLKLVVVTMFAYLTWGIVSVAEGERDRLHPLAVMGFLLAVHLLMAIFIYRMYRHRDGQRQV